jgi:hypothetical protein
VASTALGGWRSCLVWVLVASTALSGCALHRDAKVVGVYAPAADVNLGVYPAGTPVRLRLTSGERVEGVLVSVEADTVSVELKAGEPARAIAQTSIAEVSVGEVVKPGLLAGQPAAVKVLVGVPLFAVASWGAAWLFYYLVGKACGDGCGK